MTMPLRRVAGTLWTLGAGVFFLSSQVAAQDPQRDGTRTAIPSARAVERSGTIDIDGRLLEDGWLLAPIATGFVQLEPIEGAPAEEQTEVRVLFDEAAVYVAARMYDSEPASIADQLVRRDSPGQYDRFEVAFDPNRDRRTAYLFSVSAANVQADVYFFDDSEADAAWDAVWMSAVQRDSLGWTAELRIPLSQMRYEASGDQQRWGVNFFRRRIRTNEETHFGLISQLQHGMVSQFATLEGMQIPRASQLVEFRPYVLGSSYTAPSVLGDPFFDGAEFDSRAGMDFRYGLGAQFTLDATINPDFGQVEADPAVINLTAFETRFEERRPFFVEDAQIFNFSLSAGQDLYYSRRIGGRPHGRQPPGAEFVDVPDAATIVAAAKVTGRTTRGLSAGVLAALTREETGLASYTGAQPTESFRVEPRTGFGVFRLQQDFNGGASTIGGIATVLSRDLQGDGSFNFLPRTALSAAIDFEHQWGDRTWAVFGYVSTSHVRGDSTAMIRIQRSSNHFFQRPDALRLEVDSSATSLSGVDWRFTFARRRGEHWTGSVWLAETTPEFEINDLGFSRRQEALDGGARLRYQEISPGPLLRSYSTTFSTHQNFSHDVLEDPWSFDSWQRGHVSGQFSLEGEFELLNYWEIEADLSLRPQMMDRTATRGGPLMLSPRSHTVEVGLQTDRRKRFNLGTGVNYQWSQLDAGWEVALGVWMDFRPSPLVELEVGPQYSRSRTAAQYVSTTDALPYQPTFGSRYLFGDIERQELSLETRLDVVFSPTMSLQLFAQPLLSSGDYLSYRQLVAPETFDFDVFEEGSHELVGGDDVCRGGRTCLDTDRRRYFDFDADGTVDYSTEDRDFNVRSLVGNIVFRWEYRPGSTIFLVWQRLQEDEVPVGSFDFGRDLSAMVTAPAENVFMVKVNYWFAL
jgi:hypothetical protein